MNTAMCVVLIRAFIRENNMDKHLIGTSGEKFSLVYNTASDSGNQEIMDCLDRIDELELINHCFFSD